LGQRRLARWGLGVGATLPSKHVSMKVRSRVGLDERGHAVLRGPRGEVLDVMGVMLGLVLAAAPTMRVDPASRCAPEAALRRELARAPVTVVEGDADFEVTLVAAGPGLRLEVTRGEGDVVLERALPTTSCPEAVAAAAVIIERFMREVAVSVVLRPADRRGPRTARDSENGASKGRRGSMGTGAPDAGAASSGSAPAPGGPASGGLNPGVISSTDPSTTPPPPGSPASGGSGTKRLGPASPSTPAVSPSGPAGPASSNSGTGRTNSTPPSRVPVAPAPPATVPGATGNGRISSTPPSTVPGATVGEQISSTPPSTGTAPTGNGRISSTPPSTGTAPTIDGRISSTPPSTGTAPTVDGRINSTPPRNAPGATGDGPSPGPATSADSRPDSPRELPDATSVGEAVTPRLSVSAGGGLALPTPTPALVSPLLALDAALIFGDRWRIGLTGLFSFGGSVAIIDEASRTRGTLFSRDITFLVSGMACTSGRLQACGGVRAGVRLGIGDASGPFIFQTRTALALAPTVGPAGRVLLHLGRFFIALDLTGLVNLTTPSLGVDGLPTTITTPRFEGLGWLGVGLEAP
jgi:hypothetical protein